MGGANDLRGRVGMPEGNQIVARRSAFDDGMCA